MSGIVEFTHGRTPFLGHLARAWRNVHLMGNFDYTRASSEVDIEALATRYQNEDFWRRSTSEVEDEGPQ
jgi:hypothetical protein